MRDCRRNDHPLGRRRPRGTLAQLAFDPQLHGVAGLFDLLVVLRVAPGELADAPTETDGVFGLQIVKECPGVPSEILIPKNSWDDKSAFDQTANKLAGLFQKNFASYADGVSASVKNAGPAAK